MAALRGDRSSTRRCTCGPTTASPRGEASGRHLGFHNGRRPHSSLDGRTPDRAYFDGLPQLAAA